MIRAILPLILLAIASQRSFAAEDRRARVLNDRTEVQSVGHWIYNDLPQAFAEAARTRKPMLVVFRCVL